MSKKPKQRPYGVWRNLTKKELDDMKKQTIGIKKPTFEETIKAMAKTLPISNEEIAKRHI